MKLQVAATLSAAITPFAIAGEYVLRPSLNQRLSEVRSKSRKLSSAMEVEAAQTFFVPFPEKMLFDETFKVINSEAEGDVESIISLAISTDGSKVYYDHWEDGYEDDPMQPTQMSTEIWGDGDHTNGCRPDITCDAANAASDVLNGGESIVIENTIPLEVGDRDLTNFLYDGRDLLQALHPIAMTRGAYPIHPGAFMAGAVEMFEVEAWGKEYKIPVDQATLSNHDAFSHVGIFVMASKDNTDVSVGGIEFTLNKGETHFMEVVGGIRGATISATNDIEVNLVTGDKDSTYELRWFSLRPVEAWSTQYLSPVGDSKAQTKVVVYNPHDAPIVVDYSTADGEYSLTVPVNDVAYTEIIDDDNACMLTSKDTFIALSISDTTAGHGDQHDWGFPVMPVEMLTSVALIGWGYGCTQNDCDYYGMTHARSIVWVAAMENATIYVDYENDGNVDEFHDIEFLQSVRITDPTGEKDLSGALIWATEPGSGQGGPQIAIAAAWGQYAKRAYGGDEDALDLGTVVVPFPPISATKTYELLEEPVGDRLEGVLYQGDTFKYIIELTSTGPSDLAPGVITIKDILDDNCFYVEGTTVYKDETDSAIPIPDDGAGTPFPLDGDGTTNPVELPHGAIHHIEFIVQVTTEDIAVLENNGEVNVGPNKELFYNVVPVHNSPDEKTLNLGLFCE